MNYKLLIFLILASISSFKTNSIERSDDDTDYINTDLEDIEYKRNFADSGSQSEYFCEILNKKFRKEYLYALSGWEGISIFRRDVYLSSCSRPLFGTQYMYDEEDGIWNIIPVPDEKNAFFIRNNKYGEYLYAADKFLSLGSRPVFTWKSSKKNNFFEKEQDKNAYKWYINRSPTGVGYTIWNLKFDERKIFYLFFFI